MMVMIMMVMIVENIFLLWFVSLSNRVSCINSPLPLIGFKMLLMVITKMAQTEMMRITMIIIINKSCSVSHVSSRVPSILACHSCYELSQAAIIWSCLDANPLLSSLNAFKLSNCIYSDPLSTWKSNSLKSKERIQSQGRVSPIWQSVYMSHNLERSPSFTLRAFFVKTRCLREELSFSWCFRGRYPLRTQAVSVSCILPSGFMKHLARDDNWSTIRGQFDLLMLSVIGTSWRSSRASSKRARGKHPSRSALGPFHPEILPPDWPSPITLANAGFWLVEAGSLGMQRPVWELPEVETSQQHSWLEFLGSDREAELGKAFRRERLFNCTLGMSWSDFAVCNNKQTFFPLIYYHWATLGSFFSCFYSARFVYLFLSTIWIVGHAS